MEDLLIQTLESFGYPVRRQGSLGEKERYPDRFFTFWENGSYDKKHYDNHTHSVVHDYDINFYSIDPKQTYDKLREAMAVLKRNGFIVIGSGYDIGSDEKTHTGRGFNALYMKTITGQEG